MMETTLLLTFMLSPAITIVLCRPRLWPLWLGIALIPPVGIFFIFILKILIILHGAVT